MRIVGNVIWLVLGGVVLALGYVIAGVISCVLIITIPFGIASFRLAGYALWPFGRVVVEREKGSVAGIRLIGNIVWLVCGGLWLAVGHLIAALLCAITIIGIPFAIAHMRLAGLALMPLGKQVVSISAARAMNARTAVAVSAPGEDR